MKKYNSIYYVLILCFCVTNCNVFYVICNKQRKCEQYWPDSGTKSYGEINVESIDVETFADFKIRKFLISKVSVFYLLYLF